MSELLLSKDSRRYERFQPQGGRDIRTREQDGRRNHGKTGAGSDRVHQVSERRSCARGPAALDQGVAGRFRQAARLRQLHGATFGLAQIRSLLLVALAAFATGCSHKATVVEVPPAPPAQQTTPAGTPPKQSGQSHPPAPAPEALD